MVVCDDDNLMNWGPVTCGACCAPIFGGAGLIFDEQVVTCAYTTRGCPCCAKDCAICWSGLWAKTIDCPCCACHTCCYKCCFSFCSCCYCCTTTAKSTMCMAYFFYALAAIPACVFVTGCSSILASLLYHSCDEPTNDTSMPASYMENPGLLQLNSVKTDQPNVFSPPQQQGGIMIPQSPQQQGSMAYAPQFPQQQQGSMAYPPQQPVGVSNVVVDQPRKVQLQTQTGFT